MNMDMDTILNWIAGLLTGGTSLAIAKIFVNKMGRKLSGFFNTQLTTMNDGFKEYVEKNRDTMIDMAYVIGDLIEISIENSENYLKLLTDEEKRKEVMQDLERLKLLQKRLK